MSIRANTPLMLSVVEGRVKTRLTVSRAEGVEEAVARSETKWKSCARGSWRGVRLKMMCSLDNEMV